MPLMGILLEIHRKGTCGVSALCSELGVTNAAISQLLDKLEQQNLIIRSIDTNDRRVKPIILTEHGLQFVQEGIQLRQKMLEQLTSSLTPEEQNQSIVILTKLLAKAKEIFDQPVVDN
jgi:MarR family 2-MHQ and catechol resistance regulon transcriptional repressor